MTNADPQTSRRYKRPPIVEAAFEIRFQTALSLREMDRLRDRFKRTHPSVEEQRQIQVELQAQKARVNASNLVGYKLTAPNALDAILLQEHSIGSSRLAPYEGWEAFISTARENFEVFSKIAGHKITTRVAARFINRIDIPNGLFEGREIATIIKTFVALPEEVTRVAGAYNLAINFIETSTSARVLLQSGILVPPPLLDHTSVTLDIDASIDSDLPAHKEGIWRVAETLRSAKNRVFEGMITDDLRALFE